MYLPVYPIKKIDAKGGIEIGIISMSGTLPVMDLTKLFEGDNVILRMPFLMDDYRIGLDQKKQLAQFTCRPYNIMEEYLKDGTEKSLFFQYRNELYFMLDMKKENLTEKTFNGEKYAEITIPLNQCLYGWVCRHKVEK